MKIKSSTLTYSAFAAASVLGLSALTGCGSMSAKPMMADAPI